MNYIKLIFRTTVCILMFFTLFSCEQWLDVQPKTIIKSENVFEEQEYFEQALIGVYIKLSDKPLYGQELSFYFIDVLADIYDFTIDDAYYFPAARRDYVHSTNEYIIERIWSNAYNAIANINNILEHIETQTILDDVTAALIEGEARGLRAYIHLDLLRIFGPANLINNPSGLQELSIPYVQKFEKFLSSQLNTSEALKLVHDDLDKAIELLNKGDIYGEQLDASEGQSFSTADRQFRFNYWAALATKARAYLWEGDYENALLFSEKIIQSPVANAKFNFASESDIITGDVIFSDEIVFGLHVHDLYNSSGINSYFEARPEFGFEDDNVMYIIKDRYDAIFETDDVGQPDLRHHIFQEYDLDKAFYKYHQSGTNPSSYNNKVALIKLPEVFYMAAESLYKLGIRESDALGYLNTVRTSRALTTPIDESADLDLEIQKEYFKEMFGEGQIFYYLKRLGITTMPYSGRIFELETYDLPIPQDELDFGRN